MTTAALGTAAMEWKQPRCPSRGVDKENVLYTHNGIYAAIKKNEIMSFVENG